MYLIKILTPFFDEKGCFYGCTIEAAPLFGNNRTANEAVYREMWHRLRRDQRFKAEKTGESATFDAIIYFSASSEDNKLHGTITVNTAKGQFYHPDPKMAAVNAKRTLRYMDKLLCKFFYGGKHNNAVAELEKEFELNQTVAMNTLKSLFKIYGRSEGLFINSGDVKHAIKKQKNDV